jgi:hypothetical protein
MKTNQTFFSFTYFLCSCGLTLLGLFFEEATGGLVFNDEDGLLKRCNTLYGSAADSDAIFFSFVLFLVLGLFRLLYRKETPKLLEALLVALVLLTISVVFIGADCGDLLLTVKNNGPYFILFALLGFTFAALFSILLWRRFKYF